MLDTVGPLIGCDLGDRLLLCRSRRQPERNIERKTDQQADGSP
jgi:hypothetical protein